MVGARSGRDLEGPTYGDCNGWNGPGPGGFDYGLLRVLEEPPYGFTIRLVAQFPGQLKDPSRARGGYSDPTAAALHFGVAVLGGRPSGGGGDRHGHGQRH
ncbi:hypothetical protein PanWU01x14_174010 [Parasponia andersonii]|uniref:Uncharacterized protein n=1 Tax=Parasponia andersonii TaxID=3476 RepID=A0A2P5C930_PARAD|nr:hypothetical protein PanWU01x14_174010 [Parasponia andersonii]